MKNSGKLVSFLVPIISILLAFVIGCIIMAVLVPIPLWRWSPFGSVPSAACGT